MKWRISKIMKTVIRDPSHARQSSIRV